MKLTKTETERLVTLLRDNLKLELESRLLVSSSAYKDKHYAEFVDSMTIKQCFTLLDIFQDMPY